MKIVNVTYTLEGGAGKAVYRLHERLLDLGISSVLVTKSEQQKAERSLFEKAYNSFVYRVNKLIEMITLSKKKEYDSKYCFFSSSEFVKLPTKYIIDIVEDGDILIFHWIGEGLLNSSAIKRIYKKKKVDMYWFGVDMAPITGGCHYFWDCNGYLNNCSDCPAINSSHSNFARKQLSNKIRNFKHIRIGLLASSDRGIEVMKKAELKYNSYTKIPYPINTDIFTYSNEPESKEYFRIFFNAQNIHDIRKGWNYFKAFILELERLLISEVLNYQIELISVNYESHHAELPNLTKIKFINLGWAHDEKSLAKLYQQSNLMICTSVEDLSPLMVNEALLCGVPVFGFDNASNQEYIVENINGTIFKLGDTKGMVKKTVEYIKDRSIFKDKQTIRDSVLELHQKETWFDNYFTRILHAKY